jgi:hypothetical protein
MSFTTVVSDIQQLNYEDKVKVRSLLNKDLTEDKRERLNKKYQASLENAKSGKLNFS